MGILSQGEYSSGYEFIRIFWFIKRIPPVSVGQVPPKREFLAYLTDRNYFGSAHLHLLNVTRHVMPTNGWVFDSTPGKTLNELDELVLSLPATIVREPIARP